MSDVIRTALDAHQLDSQVVSGHLIVWCTADECTWRAGDCALDAEVDDLHDALVAVSSARRAHQAEVATTAVLEVTDRVLKGWLMTHEAYNAQFDIETALAGEG